MGFPGESGLPCQLYPANAISTATIAISNTLRGKLLLKRKAISTIRLIATAMTQLKSVLQS